MFPVLLFIPFVAALSISSYNIQSGSGFDGVYNLVRTAGAISAMKPDLIGLQEVDNNTQRHFPDDQPNILANLTGMAPYYASFRPFQGGEYGISVLVGKAVTVLDTKIFHYYDPSRIPAFTCEVPAPRDFCQGALAVRVKPNGASRDFWFVTTHIGLGMQEDEVPELIEFLNELTKTAPAVVTGDFNSTPDAPHMVALAKLWNDTWLACGNGTPGNTFSSGKPYERIDYIWVTPATGTRSPFMRCVAADLPNTQASDHFPLHATFELP